MDYSQNEFNLVPLPFQKAGPHDPDELTFEVIKVSNRSIPTPLNKNNENKNKKIGEKTPIKSTNFVIKESPLPLSDRSLDQDNK